jgi:hypothetical protein
MRDCYIFQKDQIGNGVFGPGILESHMQYYVYDIGGQLLMFTYTMDIYSMGKATRVEFLDNARFEHHPKSKKGLTISNSQFNDGTYVLVATCNRRGYSKQQWVDFFVNGEYRY